MPQVSKRFLKKDTEKQIFEVFWQALTDLKNTRQTKEFLDDLLSPTEKIMLAKRLAVAILLTKGHSYEAICDTLKVSRATVGKISLWLKLKGEGFRMVTEKIIRKKKIKQVLLGIEEEIAKFLAGHPAGKGRVESAYRRERLKGRSEIF